MSGRFDSLVLAGGGCRTFWHAGFWEEAAEPLGLTPRQIAAVSASSAMACAIIAGRQREALRLFESATRGNRKNLYLENVFRREAMFPHLGMYRGLLLDLLDADALDAIRLGPDLWVLLGFPPPWMTPAVAMLVAQAAYNWDKRVRKVVHPTTPRAFGFEPLVVSAKGCETPERLADLILASSCTPPMTPILRWNGRPVLDGGVIDNVPVYALRGDPGETLVLLSRSYPTLPRVPGRTYVQPSQPVPVTAWDYTNPSGLRATFDLGRRDGEAFVRRCASEAR